MSADAAKQSFLKRHGFMIFEVTLSCALLAIGKGWLNDYGVITGFIYQGYAIIFYAITPAVLATVLWQARRRPDKFYETYSAGRKSGKRAVPEETANRSLELARHLDTVLLIIAGWTAGADISSYIVLGGYALGKPVEYALARHFEEAEMRYSGGTQC